MGPCRGTDSPQRDTSFPRHLVPLHRSAAASVAAPTMYSDICGLSVACNSGVQGDDKPNLSAQDVSPLSAEDEGPHHINAGTDKHRPKRSLTFTDDEGRSCILDAGQSTLRAPPRPETDGSISAVTLIQASCVPPSASGTSSARGDESLIALTAELEFASKEIQQLVATMVRRQQGQLRELFDEMAAAEVSSDAALREQRSQFLEQLAALEAERRTERQQWEQERERFAEADESKRHLVDCLQGELATKAESLRTLTEQLTATQDRLSAANSKISELSRALDAMRRSTAQRSLTPTPTNNGPQSLKAPPDHPNRTSLPRHHSFVVSGFRGAERTALEEKLKRLGGEVVHCSADHPLPLHVTHVVCGTLTPKVIAGMLKTGTHVCPAEFVHASARQGSWVHECSVRSLIGDRESWVALFPRVAVPAPEERDPGTSEVCSVLQASGMHLVIPRDSQSSFDQAATPTLLKVLDAMKPAFLNVPYH